MVPSSLSYNIIDVKNLLLGRLKLTFKITIWIKEMEDVCDGIFKVGMSWWFDDLKAGRFSKRLKFASVLMFLIIIIIIIILRRRLLVDSNGMTNSLGASAHTHKHTRQITLLTLRLQSQKSKSWKTFFLLHLHLILFQTQRRSTIK